MDNESDLLHIEKVDVLARIRRIRVILLITIVGSIPSVINYLSHAHYTIATIDIAWIVAVLGYLFLHRRVTDIGSWQMWLRLIMVLSWIAQTYVLTTQGMAESHRIYGHVLAPLCIAGFALEWRDTVAWGGLGVVSLLVINFADPVHTWNVGDTSLPTHLASIAYMLPLLLVFNRDQARHRQEIASARARAEVQTVKGEILSALSHELRTPLNGVVSLLDMVDADRLDQEVREQVEGARTSAEAMTWMVNDVIEFARSNVQTVRLVFTEFDLGSLCHDIANTARREAKNKGLTLDVDIDDSVPPRVLFDPRRFSHVLMNLLTNAVKFTGEGQVTLCIRATADDPASDEREIEVAVTDTGCGIPPDRLQELFDAFETGEAFLNKRHRGLGLGLTLVDRIVRAAGGRIQVQSQIGQGSTFRVTLPMTVGSEEDEEEVTVKEPPEPSLASSPEHRHCLIAEDNLINQKIAMRALERMGYSHEVAKNGQEAIDRFLAAPSSFDLVLMDIQMPVMDGLTATQELRARGASIPIIALTAHLDPSEKHQCFEAGMSGFLSKPFKYEQLQETIDEAFRERTA